MFPDRHSRGRFAKGGGCIQPPPWNVRTFYLIFVGIYNFICFVYSLLGAKLYRANRRILKPHFL